MAAFLAALVIAGCATADQLPNYHVQIRRQHLALMGGERDRPLAAPGAPPAPGAVQIFRLVSLMAVFSQYSMDSRA